MSEADRWCMKCDSYRRLDGREGVCIFKDSKIINCTDTCLYFYEDRRVKNEKR